MARHEKLRRWLAGWLGTLRRQFFGWLTVPRAVALLLGLLGVAIGFGGYLVVGWEQLLLDFYANVATTLVGITIAVLTIDLLNKRRAERQLKAQLIREMGSTDNGIALRAINELRVRGELQDGSLEEINLAGANLQEADLSQSNFYKASLSRANLRSANLSKAVLQGAYLHRANLECVLAYKSNLRGVFLRKANLKTAYIDGAELQGAYLDDTNLQAAIIFDCNLLEVRGLGDRQLLLVAALRGTTLPNGQLYDGRYNLKGDILGAAGRNINFANYLEVINLSGIDPATPEVMARFYGVPLEEYLAGQKWARKNLPRLRREAGLEQDEAAETVEAPQPVEPLSSSAPPAPGVPAQSLLSFTVRRLIGLFWPFIL